MAAVTTTTATTLGGFTIPWDQLRRLLPDHQWAIYGAGWVTAPGPAVVATVAYQRNDGTFVTIGTTTLPANGKAEIGPYPLRGKFAIDAGIPHNEPIVAVALQARLASSGTAATMTRWTLWLRMTPRNV